MIEVVDEGALRLIQLNRPDKANALTEEMLVALAEAVEGADAPGLVLTGVGKVFSAGADLQAVREGLATSPSWERLSGAIAGYGGLTVAALNGTVAGGAMGMVLACDLWLAVPGGKFFYPVMKMGVLPQPSDPARLAGLVGPSRAKMILLAGQKIGAEEAQAWGLVDRITDDALAEARQLAGGLGEARAGLCAEIKALF